MRDIANAQKVRDFVNALGRASRGLVQDALVQIDRYPHLDLKSVVEKVERFISEIEGQLGSR